VEVGSTRNGERKRILNICFWILTIKKYHHKKYYIKMGGRAQQAGNSKNPAFPISYWKKDELMPKPPSNQPTQQTQQKTKKTHTQKKTPTSIETVPRPSGKHWA